MARYILKLVGTNKYLTTVNGNVLLNTVNNPMKAKVYSDSMLEENRLAITSQVRKEYNTMVEVVRVFR